MSTRRYGPQRYTYIGVLLVSSRLSSKVNLIKCLVHVFSVSMAEMIEKKPPLSPALSPTDFEKGVVVDVPAADSALTFLRREGGEVVGVDEKKLVRKIDLMILP